MRWLLLPDCLDYLKRESLLPLGLFSIFLFLFLDISKVELLSSLLLSETCYSVELTPRSTVDPSAGRFF